MSTLAQADTALPLAGIRVLEIGGGAAGAYCGRLLADAGASVSVTALHEHRRLAGIVRADLASEHAYAAWLAAGKTQWPTVADHPALAALCPQFDLVLVGEDAGVDADLPLPAPASVALSWFGGSAYCRHWQGSDLIVQALTGLPQMAGTPEGPPLAAGDRQATLLGGVTAYIAACAALLARLGTGAAAAAPRAMQVSIFEANLVMAEMHLYFFERDGLPMRRCGLNRFAPNSPVGIYPCKTGWIGITVATPDQWRALCEALSLQAQARDEGLATRERRFERLDEVEQVLCQALARKTADEWATIGRQFRVPMVVVPDAQGILNHPVFEARQSLARLALDGQVLQVPRTPFGLSATPLPIRLAPAQPQAERLDPLAVNSLLAPQPRASSVAQAAQPAPPGQQGQGAAVWPAGAPRLGAPLQGITVVDFSMGWAGPLATRLMADLGAEVLKIEAARYPDWWRGMNWTPEFIAERQYELSTTFNGLNRGKQGVSLDLTTSAGQALALRLVAGADAVVENQAAGVMAKFGLAHAQLVQARPDLVMVSMSAFGTGNSWSDTRAYGSTLEQGSGLPSFVGLPGTAPAMTHLAHGDPVGGLYGCAALLTALLHRRRTGQGQYVNLSMVEAMLQLATPALLQHQLAPQAELRLGNHRASLAPHGLFPAAGDDQWLALAVHSGDAFAALARVLGRPDWASDPLLRSLAGRQQHEAEINAAVSAWSQQRPAQDSAVLLQQAGVAAAPLLQVPQLAHAAWGAGDDFFMTLERAVSGRQRQAGIAVLQAGQRLGAIQPAPQLGEHSWPVLHRHTGLTAQAYDALLRSGVIGLSPKPARNLVAQPGATPGAPTDARLAAD